MLHAHIDMIYRNLTYKIKMGISLVSLPNLLDFYVTLYLGDGLLRFEQRDYADVLTALLGCLRGRRQADQPRRTRLELSKMTAATPATPPAPIAT